VTPRAERLQALAARLAIALTPADVAKAVLEDGLPAMTSNAGSVALLDGEDLVLTGMIGFDDQLALPWQRFPVSAPTPIAEAVRSRQSVWIETPEAFRARYDRDPTPGVLEVAQAWVALPLVVRDTVFGALGASYPQPHEFIEADRRYGETLAQLCAQALERARLYDAEARARRDLNTALTLSETGSWRYDPLRHEIEYDGAFGLFHGCKPGVGQVHLEDLRQVIPLEDLERNAPLIEEAVLNGTPLELEYRVRIAGRSERWLLCRGRPEGDTPHPWLAGTVVDITARKRAEERLVEVNAAQRRFIGDAAHELRAPLTAIRGNLSLLTRFPDMPLQDRLEATREAEREAARLTRLISDLLALARGEAREAFVMDGVALHALLEQVWHRARSLSGQHVFELGTLEPCWVNGDPDALQQVGFILLENAVKYTPEGGRIALSLRRIGEHAQVRVTDSGSGIAEHDLPFVFERFFRADRARTRTGRSAGTGLGLTIARQIVDAHEGRIWLESALGTGTSAVIELPLVRADDQAIGA
jgi:signal transduction histidine kinase